VGERAGEEAQMLRFQFVAVQLRVTEGSCGAHRGEMLRLQAWLAAPRPDVGDLQRTPGYRGQRDTGADDLSATLAIRAVYPDELFCCLHDMPYRIYRASKKRLLPLEAR